jgi:hypothetical protein
VGVGGTGGRALGQSAIKNNRRLREAADELVRFRHLPNKKAAGSPLPPGLLTSPTFSEAWGFVTQARRIAVFRLINFNQPDRA